MCRVHLYDPELPRQFLTVFIKCGGSEKNHRSLLSELKSLHVLYVIVCYYLVHYAFCRMADLEMPHLTHQLTFNLLSVANVVNAYDSGFILLIKNTRICEAILLDGILLFEDHPSQISFALQ